MASESKLFRNEAKVLVLYTGGTIGMVRNFDGALAPLAGAFEQRVRNTNTLHDVEYAKTRFGGSGHSNLPAAKSGPPVNLVLPDVPFHRKVLYAIEEYVPLLDSSNMSMDDWIRIAVDVERYYRFFDGFVVLHGTDTLAYSASALSFMLEHLGKPVIITGSQIPCFETRSDGRDNLVGALILAANYNVPEVTVYFRHRLLRGNRTVKSSSGDLDAFHSPNMAPLVKAGINFEVDHGAIHRCLEVDYFRVSTRLNRNVALLRLFPSIKTELLSHFLAPPIEGVVLQCYGAGNVPSSRSDVMTLLGEATRRGVIIVCVTQCTHGGVSELYATGKALMDMGVVSGNDLTTEAALTKLSYVLAKDEWSLETKRHMMAQNLRGEITVSLTSTVTTNALISRGPILDRSRSMESLNETPTSTEYALILAVAEQLNMKSSDELQQLRNALFPSLLCSAVAMDSPATLIRLLESHGADLAMADYDTRTPLHVACSDGNLKLVNLMLQHGANVHVRDRFDESPLQCAINAGHQHVVQALVKAGSHLHLSDHEETEVAELLVSLARQGRTEILDCYKAAGVDFNALRSLNGQTVLHAAVEGDQPAVVDLAIEAQIDLNITDLYGRTAQDIANVLGRTQLLEKLRSTNVTTTGDRDVEKQ